MKILVTIPVFNEERKVSACVQALHQFLHDNVRLEYELLIADNGSTDRTFEISQHLSAAYPGVRSLHLDLKGRGGALKEAWKESRADVLSYMDVDLSTDINAFPIMIEALVSGQYDLATGSRLQSNSMTTRSLTRECLSRGYNALVKFAFHTRFSDAQCGFKAITRQAANRLLPLVEDNHWFFDTELLVLADKLDYRIFDLPVRWVENRDSRVKIWQTVVDDLKGIRRLRRQLAEGKGRLTGSESHKLEVRGSRVQI